MRSIILRILRYCNFHFELIRFRASCPSQRGSPFQRQRNGPQIKTKRETKRSIPVFRAKKQKPCLCSGRLGLARHSRFSASAHVSTLSPSIAKGSKRTGRKSFPVNSTYRKIRPKELKRKTGTMQKKGIKCFFGAALYRLGNMRKKSHLPLANLNIPSGDSIIAAMWSTL